MSKKHTILMILCCVIGMGAAAAILVFGVPANKVLTGFLILLCPISHLLMMKFMMKGHDHGADSSDSSTRAGESCHVQQAPVKADR